MAFETVELQRLLGVWIPTKHPAPSRLRRHGLRGGPREDRRKSVVDERPRRTGSRARASIPDAARLVDVVLEESTGKHSSIHGESHWQRVAATGLALLPETPEADPTLVFLFALFHDSMRLNDSFDPMHGPRAAVLAQELRGGAFDLDEASMETLTFACEEHTNGGIGPDPTVGVCWDADRLNLWRVGITPDPRFLSTEAAKGEERISWARDLQRQHFVWADLYGAFGLR